MLDYVWLIPFFPMLGFLINGLYSRWIHASKKFVSWVACSALGLSFLSSALVFISMLKISPEHLPYQVNIFDWIVAGNLKTVVGYQVDALSMVMALVVSGVSFVIHIYSVGYMHEDPDFTRYFTYLNLFVFMMLTLVLANNFLLMFVGWEGVGLCSYLLIGFWFEKDSASNAGKKAFVVNRIGDFGFLLGMFLIFVHFGTFDFTEVFNKAPHTINTALATAITILLFIGATGKSAQLPLYVWLPDAMEGPTPVSSLIHAATMVTAGVYMIARCNVLFSMAPITMGIVATVGALTAIYAASMGFFQFDIKRVLAYSTISQLGYMFLAVGVGAYSAGIFHLMTHAFFKGLLFLGAGSIMHALSGELDMRKMGGLRKKVPITFYTFFAATLAISGCPFFSGFFSKDEILWQAFSSPHGHFLLWLIGVVAAGMTAFYMFRLVFNVFFGECRAEEEVKKHIHESPPIMTIPLIILAILSVIGGYVGVPHALGGSNRFHKFLEPVVGPGPGSAVEHAKINLNSMAYAAEHGTHAAHSASLEYILMLISIICAAIGVWIAYYYYIKHYPEKPKEMVEKFKGIYTTIQNKYYVDEIYGYLFVNGAKNLAKTLWIEFDVKVIDRTANLIAEFFRWSGSVIRVIQTGLLQDYALAILIGGVAVLYYFLK